jgi:hypothetical protein
MQVVHHCRPFSKPPFEYGNCNNRGVFLFVAKQGRVVWRRRGSRETASQRYGGPAEPRSRVSPSISRVGKNKESANALTSLSHSRQGEEDQGWRPIRCVPPHRKAKPKSRLPRTQFAPACIPADQNEAFVKLHREDGMKRRGYAVRAVRISCTAATTCARPGAAPETPSQKNAWHDRDQVEHT